MITRITGAGPDRDGDGLPDAWEEASGLDPDGDGATNAHEYAAGTNPLDAASALKLEVSTDRRVAFRSVPDRRYQLERTAALTSPWETVGPQISGTGDLIHLNAAPDGPSVFYRVRLVR